MNYKLETIYSLCIHKWDSKSKKYKNMEKPISKLNISLSKSRGSKVGENYIGMYTGQSSTNDNKYLLEERMDDRR